MVELVDICYGIEAEFRNSLSDRYVAIQVLRNPIGGRGGGIKFPGKNVTGVHSSKLLALRGGWV